MLLEMCLLFSTWVAVLPLCRVAAMSSNLVKSSLPNYVDFQPILFYSVGHPPVFLLLPCKSVCGFTIAEFVRGVRIS